MRLHWMNLLEECPSSSHHMHLQVGHHKLAAAGRRLCTAMRQNRSPTNHDLRSLLVLHDIRLTVILGEAMGPSRREE